MVIFRNISRARRLKNISPDLQYLNSNFFSTKFTVFVDEMIALRALNDRLTYFQLTRGEVKLIFTVRPFVNLVFVKCNSISNC